MAIFGGLLLTWQAYQVRKWAVIHEDIVSLVRFAEEQKTKTRSYSLTGYQFKRPWVEKHIYSISFDETNGWRVHYFMNDAGITYWYSSKTGFGYYPD